MAKTPKLTDRTPLSFLVNKTLEKLAATCQPSDSAQSKLVMVRMSGQPSSESTRLPFGDPDGARADLDRSVTDFISIDEKNFSSGISISDADRNIRIVVGKKGSGKTVYLRRLRESARREVSVFASKIAKDIPSTNSVVEFCQIFSANRVTEAWQTAWRNAILNSVYTHLVTKSIFAQYIDQSDLRQKYTELFGSGRRITVERSPYSELKDIISKHRSDKNFWQDAADSKWDDLQTILGNCLKQCPPIFFYLDASDDEFSHAPMDWHRCQKGLFYAVIRMLGQAGAIASRLHAVIAIRDIVFSSVLQSEHRTRYIGSPSIALLDWNRSAIKFFYEQKLMLAPPGVFFEPETRSSASFLGIEKITNERRSILEDATSYLLRHTRSIPRDIIQVCNAVAQEKVEVGDRLHDRKFWERRLRRVISSNAAMFAEEQIQVCANQLSSHDAPSRSARHHYSELYTSDQEYIESKATIVKNFIRAVGRERFSYEDLQIAEMKMESQVPKDVSISTILWQHGLIGIRSRDDGSYFSFYSLKENAGFMLSAGADEYAFHSILLDAITDLEMTSNYPVCEAEV